jgi:thiol-disulfide isomerase/thioredoxin
MAWILPIAVTILCLSVVLPTAVAGKDNLVRELEGDDIADAIDTYDVTVVQYYAPWCGHCKELMPEFKEAAALSVKRVETKSVFAIVDCTTEVNAARCSESGVRSFPTVKMNIYGESFTYSGARTADAIVDQLIRLLIPTGEEIRSQEDFDIMLMNPSTLVGFVEPGSKQEKAYDLWSQGLRGRDEFDWMVIAKITNSSLMAELGRRKGDLVLYRTLEDQGNLQHDTSFAVLPSIPYSIAEFFEDETMYERQIINNAIPFVEELGIHNNRFKEHFLTSTLGTREQWRVLCAVDKSSDQHQFTNIMFKIFHKFRNNIRIAFIANKRFHGTLANFGIDTSNSSQLPKLILYNENEKDYAIYYHIDIAGRNYKDIENDIAAGLRFELEEVDVAKIAAQEQESSGTKVMEEPAVEISAEELEQIMAQEQKKKDKKAPQKNKENAKKRER